jgi:hypothetical protein
MDGSCRPMRQLGNSGVSLFLNALALLVLIAEEDG